MKTPPRPPTAAALSRAARRAEARRRWVFRLGTLALGLVVSIPLGELVARILKPSGNADLLFGSPLSAPYGLYVTDPQLLQVPAANFQGEVSSLDFRVPIRTNQLGLRGPEVPPRSLTPRWLVVGDSFTLSVQVPEEQTFQAGLATRLGAEVWNAGVDGYSTWQATGRYERLEPELDPDGVLLLFFTGNDLADNTDFPKRLANASGMPTGVPVTVPTHSGLERWLIGHSYLYGQWRVRQRANALASGQDMMFRMWQKELMLFHQDGASLLQQGMSDTWQALQQLQQATEAHGDRLVVAVTPPAFAINQERIAPTMTMVGLDPARADVDAPALAVMGVLESLGIRGCDLTSALRAERARGLYYTFDGHWTPEGHALVAELLEACVRG